MSVDLLPKKSPLSDNEKHARHSEAQRRYRERNLESTRAKARERMQRQRSKILSPEQRQDKAEKRREKDADFRQLQRSRKFVAKYGYATFIDLYLPEFEAQGKKHLPGLRLDALARKRSKELETHWSEM
ncbi:hypothetical protein B0H15DRAFT_951691 [Mycena belliarum]|uniref:Uncharacterized protein n=1 Tax=Mycena belliarum TaxID=1033014 RepID=A0AAD6U3T9_9AGAR|nr:hypothetical protein B0H15DRAFT_951691 [Mycena belliae]